MMAKTKQPTGLTITRNGNSYVFKWKIADKDYSSGQTLQYRTKSLSAGWRSWNAISVGSTTTSKSVSIPKADFYPLNDPYCTAIEFRVRGKRGNYTQKGKTIKPDWSDWTNKVMDISVPRAPSLSVSLGDVWNVSRYTWSIVSNDNDARVFTQYQWQTILVKNCNIKDGSKLKWSSSNSGWDTGSGTAVNYSKSITEDTAIASGSYTRWFRIRARGQAGNSEWKYAKHVFALPNSATIKSHKVTKKADRYLLDLVWEASASASRPIDETTVEYAKEVPIANMLPPVEPSWDTGQVSKDTSGNDKASFHISGLLDDDYCLFARVVTKHDDRENYSAVRLVAKGKLANPSDVSVTLSGNVATVSATNNSSASVYTGSVAETKRLFLQVYYKGKKYYKSGISVGIIPYGSSSEQITIPRPTGETAYSIGVKAVVGTYTRSRASDGTYRYTVKADMVSQRVWTTADVPVAPSNLQADYDGNLNVTWDWSWDDAEGVEISWSTDEDAWVSTESPETYTIDGQATRLVIKNIDAGTRYYVRARFKSGDDFSDYSNTISVETTLPPEKPVLSLSSGVISESGKITASWNYVSNDGTEQDYAEIICNNEVIAHTSYGTHITLYAEDLEWQSGNEYGLQLRVKSSSGSFSEYSDTVTVSIAPSITATISSTSLETVSVIDDSEITRNVLSLTEMPLTVKVDGANNGDITQLILERAEQYSMDRPDESTFNGYDGETVYINNQTGDDLITVNASDLIGPLDDGAKYRIIATVKDGIGQTATDEMDFEVHWNHQAIEPTGTVVIDETIAKVTPIAPQGTENGDVCDIYRLSSDKPVLIYPNAEFGTTYVDPYPAINGGYRLVFKTSNGDYITEDERPAWVDIDSEFEYDKSIIEFAKDKVELYYNVDTDSSWSKDFVETQYLGGSVQGDWNPAVSRSGNISGLVLDDLEPETVTALRRLAVYSGICNVRTTKGSSYHANVDVSESAPHDRYGMITEFSLSITRVDPQGYDGIPLTVWEG